jgi:CheY-like chemotaxis protein
MDDRLEDQEFSLGPPRQEWPHARGKECVVVAEDSEALRDLVLAMLSGLGYEVLTAGGGHEALRQIDRHHGVDLVITDAIMPRGGGFEIIDEMRARWPGTPIVITSGFTEEIEAGLRERTPRREARGRVPAELPDSRASSSLRPRARRCRSPSSCPSRSAPSSCAPGARVIDRSRSDARKRG